ncbi:MAG TPA: creatininase family protein [Vicinamibacterales bacterium]|nr:creatininase family protein [Vicinamibacterales bacterium]
MRTLIALAVLLVASTASAQTRSVFIDELTWPEIREAQAAGKTSALIFAGGIEQNGPHMALAKHNVIARHVAGQIAERLNSLIVYPVVPFSMAGDPIEKTGHMRLPGTVSLPSEVFLGVIRGVALSAISAGFKNVFVTGDHGGGQAELKLAAETLDADWRAKGVHVYYLTNTKAAQQVTAYFTEHKVAGGGHAGVAETAQVMFLDQSQRLIRKDKFPVSAAGPESTTGTNGNPSLATSEMGRLFLGYKIADGVEQIQKLTVAK